MSGTFDLDTKTVTISGGDYTPTGTYGSGAIIGSGSTPTGEVSFIAMDVAATVTRFCGAYKGDDSGNQMMLVVSGSKVLLSVSSGGGKALTGSVSGGTVTITDSADGVTVHGTISGGSASGTWSTTGGGTGTWSATSATCSG